MLRSRPPNYTMADGSTTPTEKSCDSDCYQGTLDGKTMVLCEIDIRYTYIQYRSKVW